MDAGEQTTGTRDEHYNVVSVLYHALQGADTCDQYALDAEAEGQAGIGELLPGGATVADGDSEPGESLCSGIGDH